MSRPGQAGLTTTSLQKEGVESLSSSLSDRMHGLFICSLRPHQFFVVRNKALILSLEYGSCQMWDDSINLRIDQLEGNGC